jgi:hypothetical protein
VCVVIVIKTLGIHNKLCSDSRGSFLVVRRESNGRPSRDAVPFSVVDDEPTGPKVADDGGLVTVIFLFTQDVPVYGCRPSALQAPPTTESRLSHGERERQIHPRFSVQCRRSLAAGDGGSHFPAGLPANLFQAFLKKLFQPSSRMTLMPASPG